MVGPKEVGVNDPPSALTALMSFPSSAALPQTDSELQWFTTGCIRLGIYPSSMAS